MATPNQMPKKNNTLHQQVLAGLIETRDASWNRKVIRKDDEGKEVVDTVKQKREALRFPLAANLSDANVQIVAERWLQ